MSHRHLLLQTLGALNIYVIVYLVIDGHLIVLFHFNCLICWWEVHQSNHIAIVIGTRTRHQSPYKTVHLLTTILLGISCYYKLYFYISYDLINPFYMLLYETYWYALRYMIELVEIQMWWNTWYWTVMNLYSFFSM